MLALIIYIANAFANQIPQREVDENFKPQYGVSYSFEHAQWYGLDAREAYVKLLDEVKFDWVRLSFFWDRHTKSGGELNLEELEFAIEEAQKRDIKVVIALGLKTPYYPEYHPPQLIREKIEFGQRLDASHPIAKDVIEIDREVVEVLARWDNIIFWQVENEPLIGNVNRWKIDASLVAAEVDTVRAADFKKRPVILNHAGVGFYDASWKDLLPILQKGDVFAVNAFFKTKGIDLVTAKIFGQEIHILWPDHLVWPVHSWGILSPDFESFKKAVESHGSKLWVLEMQAEPYVKNLGEAGDPLLSFTPADIGDANRFLRSYGIESVGFWGAHFWQYREKMGDDSWMEEVKQVVNQ